MFPVADLFSLIKMHSIIKSKIFIQFYLWNKKNTLTFYTTSTVGFLSIILVCTTPTITDISDIQILLK